MIVANALAKKFIIFPLMIISLMLMVLATIILILAHWIDS